MATLTVPYSFVPATNIVASEMNSNFGAVKTFVEALAAGTNLDAGAVTTSKLATATIQLLAPTGVINAYAGSIAPSGWLLCDGAAVSRATYADLFALIGTTYGAGDGTSTFNVPNLKGRVAVGRDATQTEFDVLGETGGAKTHTLTSAEMPSHSHTADGDLTAASSLTTHSHTADGDLTAASAGSHDHSTTTDANGSHSHTGTVDSGGFHDHSASTRNTTSSTHTHQSGTRFSVGATATNESDTSRNVDYGGTHTHTFTSAAAGSHAHAVTIGVGGTHGHDITGSTSATNLAHTHDITGSTSNTGGGGAHNNLQPYLVVNYIIKI